MAIPARKPPGSYTWDDYRTWPDDERWEIIGGEPFAMSPSPESKHQIISMEIGSALVGHFRGKPCRVFAAPMDVRLSDRDVVQPDLLVVCRKDQIKRTHIDGPPSLVVEIVSPTSTRHDRIRKLNLYAAAGIREYWIVTPVPAMVEVLELEANGAYRIAGVYDHTGTLTSPTFPDLRLELAPAFAFDLEPDERIDEIREGTPPYRVQPATP